MNRTNGSRLCGAWVEFAVATILAVALSLLLSSCRNASTAHSIGDPTVGTLVTAGSMIVGRSLPHGHSASDGRGVIGRRRNP